MPKIRNSASSSVQPTSISLPISTSRKAPPARSRIVSGPARRWSQPPTGTQRNFSQTTVACLFLSAMPKPSRLVCWNFFPTNPDGTPCGSRLTSWAGEWFGPRWQRTTRESSRKRGRLFRRGAGVFHQGGLFMERPSPFPHSASNI